MLVSTQAATLLADHDHWHGPGWWAPLFFLGWIVIFWLIFGFFARRFWWRRCGGPGGPGWYGGPGWRHGYQGDHPGGYHGASSAESALAERYANGEIDETEFRKRRAVLREGHGEGRDKK